MAGLIAGLGVVGAAYGVSAIATHGETAKTEQHADAVAQKPGTTVASSQLVASGGALYSSIGCIGCHGAQAKGGGIGPSLHHLGDPDSKIARNISNGFAGRMPPYKDKLTPPQISSLVAYIQSYE